VSTAVTIAESSTAIDSARSGGEKFGMFLAYCSDWGESIQEQGQAAVQIEKLQKI